MQALASRLSERFGGAQAFFCNSGAEANEAALKYARKATGKTGFVALEGSLPRPHVRRAVGHGPARQAGAVRAARRPASRFVDARRHRSLTAAVGADTALILVEPIQGEGGVHPRRRRSSSRAARELADDARRPADLRRGADRRRPHRHASSPGEQLGVKPRPRHAREGARERPADRRAARLRRRARRLRPGRPRARPSAATPSPAPQRAPSCDEITDELFANVQRAERPARRRAAASPGVIEVRGRGLLLGGRRRPTGRRA